VFFDLEKAYDTTWRHGCLADLHKAGLKGHLPIFISNFLSDRHFKVRTGTTLSDLFPQEMGVPQGSILSVTLFGLRINDIVKTLSPAVQCCLYVDDFTIYIRSATLPDAEQQLQQTINNLQTWCDHNGFKFSPAKSECILFRRPRAKPRDPILTLNGSNIPVATEIKYLGIILDNKLTFISHITQLKTKCLKSLNILKVVAHYDWGGDKCTLLNLYRTLIRSRIDYGCFIYGSARPSYIKMLHPVINQALRLCLGAFRTSPEDSLHVEAGELPLALRRTKLALQYAVKLAANPSHPTYNSIFQATHEATFRTLPKLIPPLGIRLATDLQQILPNPSTITRTQLLPLPPWHIATPTVILDDELITMKNTTAPHVLRSRFGEISLQYPDHQPIFTDGSKVGSHVAAAAIIPPHTLQQRLPDGSSIYSAELTAIQIAITHITQQQEQRNYIIFSDSQSALKAIANATIDNTIIADILTKLHDRTTTQKIIFCWIPSHVGIKGNEAADQAAKAALSLPICNATIPASDLRPSITKLVTEAWQKIWDSKTNNKLHAIQPRVNQHQNNPRTSRRNEITISRLRIGHTRITHSHLLEGGPPPICIPCNQPLTVQHILIDCIDFQNSRTKHYTSTNIKELLSTSQPSPILNFLKEIHLYSKI